MHTSEVEKLLRSDGGSPGRSWPPRSEAESFELARERRRRYQNDRAALWMYRTDLHVPESPKATAARFRDYTPVGLAKDLARFAAALLFAEPAKLTVDDEVAGPALDAWSKFNKLDQLLQDGGEYVAALGSGGLRIIKDDRISSRFPLIVHEPSDRIVWAQAHGRYTTGGVVIVEREDKDQVRWRMLEYHAAGTVKRALFKGTLTHLGVRVPLSAGPLEFQGLRDEVNTGVDRPTLVRWDYTPSRDAVTAGIEPLLDALDDAETTGRKKLRASKPLQFIHRKLADDAGNADVDDAILLGEGTMSPVEEPNQLAQVIQGRVEAEDFRIYANHLRELAVSMAGFSNASWGDGQDGRADSGRALRLRQMRTILTRAGVERMAREAISEACGVALALMLDRPDVEPLKPEIQFGDGFPDDPVEQAETLTALVREGLMSTEQAVRELHPEWAEDKVGAEVGRIVADGDLVRENAVYGGSRALDNLLNGDN